MSDHPFSTDFLSMLDAAPHIDAIAAREVAVFHALEDAITTAQRPAVIIELALATWTAYLVKHLHALPSPDASPHELAAALYLAMDLHLATGEGVQEQALLDMFQIPKETSYAHIAQLARPIFSYLSSLSPEVLQVVIQQFRDHRHTLNHPQHARELERLARTFWSSEPALDAIKTLPREQLILRITLVPHEPSSHDPQIPEPSLFFVIRDAQSDAPRALLPWYGAIDTHARLSALRRATLEAILAPHQGTAAMPVAIVAPEEADIKPLMLKLGLPEIVILSPSQMP